MKKHNFSAGPAILPREVIEGAARAVLELDDIGLSLIEISHRSQDFIQIMDEAVNLSIRLLGLEGKGYKALFLQLAFKYEAALNAFNPLYGSPSVSNVLLTFTPHLLPKLPSLRISISNVVIY